MTRLRALLLTLALALLPGVAAAQSSGLGWAAYLYPAPQASTICTPLCTSASMEWRQPSVTYSGSGTDNISIWLGMRGSFTDNQDSSGNCPTYNCLGQFGTAVDKTGGAESHYAWYELFCSLGSSSTPIACDGGPSAPAIVTLSASAFPVAAGDRIKATMTCISGCSPNYSTSAKWAIQLQNFSAGWTWVNGSAGHTGGTGAACTTGAEGSCFNWPLGQGQVAFATEVLTGYNGPPVFSPIPISNLRVNGAAPVITNIKQGVGVQNIGSRTIYPSQLTNGGDSFFICRAAGTYSATSSSFFCANGGGYAGAGGVR